MRRVLAGFVPAEGRVFVLAKSHRPEVVGTDVRWEEENWYGTRYCVRRMGDDLLERVDHHLGYAAERAGYERAASTPRAEPVHTDGPVRGQSGSGRGTRSRLRPKISINLALNMNFLILLCSLRSTRL